MLEIFSRYWQIIVGVILLIVVVVVAIIRKKPISDILTYIYKFAIYAINDSETQATYSKTKEERSEEKKQYAIRYVCEELFAMFPNLHTELYEGLISQVIEDILSTPQKKGGK